jgi:hypothetical protein
MPEESSFEYSGSSIIYVVAFYDDEDELIGNMTYDEPIPVPSEGESIKLKEYRYGLESGVEEFNNILDEPQIVQERSMTYQYMIPEELESGDGESESEKEDISLVTVQRLKLSEKGN